MEGSQVRMVLTPGCSQGRTGSRKGSPEPLDGWQTTNAQALAGSGHPLEQFINILTVDRRITSSFSLSGYCVDGKADDLRPVPCRQSRLKLAECQAVE
jgi:hypothetical protein